MSDKLSANQLLRYQSLNFYKEDMDKITEILDEFLGKSGAISCLLIDVDGHLVTKTGEVPNMDGNAMAALTAGSFASTREVARQLGDEEFKVLFHQGAGHSIHVTLVAERTLQVAVFDSVKTKAGMVHVLAKELAVKLEALLLAIAERQAEKGDESTEQFEAGFSDDMKNQLDNLFGGL